MTAARSGHAAAPRRTPAGSTGPAHTIGPPVAALVVSSPAILSALDGRMDPLVATAVVAGALIAAWTLGAVGLHLWRDAAEPPPPPPQRHDVAVDPVSDPTGRDTSDLVGAAVGSGGGVALGQIEPIQVPAHVAVPGTPESTSPATEGPIR